MPRYLLPLLLLLGCLPWQASAAIVPAETLFVRSVEAYRAAQFQRARAGFREILDRPQSQVTSASALMFAKTLYKLKEYDRAIGSAIDAQRRFSDSRYVPELEYVVGNSQYRLGRVGEASRHYAVILHQRGTDVRLRRKSLLLLGKLNDGLMTREDLDQVRQHFGRNWTTEAVTLGRALVLMESGNPSEARHLLQDFVKRYPTSDLKDDALRALDRAPSTPVVLAPVPSVSSPAKPAVVQSTPAVSRIGLLCPLTGDDREFGEELKRGAQLAVRQAEQGKSVSLVIVDAGSESISAVKAAQTLVERDEVMAVVGPVSSGPTIGAAAMANAKRIPLLAPTASEDGIASVGMYVFQLNPTPGTYGKRIGEYAVDRMGLKTFASIASLDAYGKSLADSFASAVERSGGRVLQQEWFVHGGTTDFSGQIGRIRQAATKGKAGTSGVGSTPEASDTEDTLDLVLLDGLLIAGFPEDIALVAPQVAHRKVKTVFLGGNGWNSTDVIRRCGAVVDGAVFASENTEDGRSPVQARFSSEYKQAYGSQAGMVAALGYDALALLLKAIAAGSRTPDAIRDYLSAVDSYAGASGTITLSGGRVNGSAQILKIRDGRIVPAEE